MTLNELQILLALNGNERIEYAEEEIFVSEELYRCYLENICSNYEWFGYYDKDGDDESLWLAFTYARYVIGDRWLEAERLVATNRSYAFWYNDVFGTKI